MFAMGQVDDTGSGHALHFDGVDDYVEMQSDYSTFNLPFTISAWIKVDPANNDSALIVFSSNDNNPLYHGFFLAVGHGAIWCEYGDNLGGSNPNFRQGKRASVDEFYGKWTHVAAVMKSKTEFELYINGINVGGSSSGESTADMHSPYPGDKAKAGYLLSNGVTYRFDGDMDELRLWSRALSEQEIRDGMCKKVTGTEANLVSCWSFDETSGSTTYDKAKKTSNGILIGNPGHVFSGAPIGDNSFEIYGPVLVPGSLTVMNSDKYHDQIDVTDLGAHVKGVHVYFVDAVPSQTDGLPTVPATTHYFGVFLVGDSPLNQVTASAYYATSAIEEGVVRRCSFTRADNSVSTWGNLAEVTYMTSQQAEFARGRNPTPEITLDLGPDRTVCAGYQLYIGIDMPTERIIRWNTGEATSAIIVNHSDKYWVAVSSACSFASDTVTLNVIQQDHVDLGPDISVCDRDVVHIDAGFSSTDHTFKWNTGENTSGVEISRSGTYSVSVTGICNTTSDEINVTMLKMPPKFSLGDDSVFCILPPIHLQPPLDATSATFEWQDKSTKQSFDVKDFGTYWLSVKNACGESTDTVTYKKLDNIDLPQIPNVITPNGDDYNQCFVVPGAKEHVIDLLVLNRWGERVFTSSGYQNDWDGKGLAPGIYFYVVGGQCVNPIKGSLTIIR